MDKFGRQSNVVLGIVGALIGAALGGVVWGIVYKLGYIAGIAGFAIVAGAFKGYELLGKALDIKGVVISVLISVVMIFVAQYVSVALEVKTEYDAIYEEAVDECRMYGCLEDHEEELEEFKMSFTDVLEELPDLMDEADAWGDFISDLVVGYIFSILCAGSYIVKKAKQ